MQTTNTQIASWLRVSGVVLIGLGVSASANDSSPTAERPGWVLTFQDEVTGTHLDGTRWVARDPWGAEKNNELQGYAPGAFSA